MSNNLRLIRGLLTDSKIHILAICTLVCVFLADAAHLPNIAVLYSVLSVWMIVDYKMALMLRKTRDIVLAYLVAIAVVHIMSYAIPETTSLLLGALRLVTAIAGVAYCCDLLGLRTSRTMAIMMAAVIEIMLPVKSQASIFLAMTLYTVAGVAVTLLVGFLYYSVREHSAYQSYKKDIYNETRLVAVAGEQLKRFFEGAELNWAELRAEMAAFKDNRFFYNRTSLIEAEKVRLFHDIALDVYCSLVMLRGFANFDGACVLAVKGVFPQLDVKKTADDGEYYYENITARRMLNDYQLLEDITSNNAQEYEFKL